MIKRRDLLIASAVTASMLNFGFNSSGKAATTKSLLKPKRLQPGSIMGIVSPASATFVQEELDVVIDAVKGLGLVPRLAPHLRSRYGYLGGKDQERAADINRFFRDKDVAGILPIRGGWGCSRILPYLDYDLIRQNPKILVGFSDVTSLILGLNAKTNLVTFHGPNGYSSWNSTQTDYFRRVLFQGEAVTWQNSRAEEDQSRLMQVKFRNKVITPGKVRGKLIGGNLSVLSGIVGSPYLPNLTGAILFLEETHENIYRVDRMLTHLKIAGVLDKLAGFVFGQCIECNPDADYGSLTLEEVIADHIKPLGIPAWSGAMIGHIETLLTLPIGLDVEMDASLATIRMLEPAVQ